MPTPRPSGASTWRKCAANPTLAVADNDADDDTEVREAGTACHWAAATGAKEGAVAPNDVEIDAEMIDAVSLYRTALAQWPVPAILETPVHCAGIHEVLKGTPDAMGFDWATFTLYLADLKYGFRYVSPLCDQLICYSDGAARYLTGAPLLGGVVKRVVFTIVQPRCYSAEPVRTWEGVPEDLRADLFALSMACDEVMGPNPQGKINPGCRNCSGRHQCPTLRNAVGAIVDSSEDATPTGLPFEAQEYELRYTRDAIDVLTAYATGLEQQVAYAIKRGARSRYFEMSHEKTPLKWDADVSDKVRAVARLMGTSIDKEPQIITPTQAKAVLGESVVTLFARRHDKAPKLRPSDPEIWRKLFKGK